MLYESFNGVVLAEEEGKNIARCLGNNKAALLQNHGLLTVGQTIEEAVFWFVSLEKCCHAQLMADAAAAGRGGSVVKIGEEEARYVLPFIPLLGHHCENRIADPCAESLTRPWEGQWRDGSVQNHFLMLFTKRAMGSTLNDSNNLTTS